MKKIIAPLLVGAALSSAFAADDSLKQEIEALKAQMAELKNAQAKLNVDALKAQVSEIKAHDAGDNIKWTVDFRTAYDYVDYKVQGGVAQVPDGAGGFTPTNVNGGSPHNSIWTNKLILGMASQPVDNLIFKGSLAAYKTYGQSYDQSGMFQNFDWYGSQKPNDSAIRLREAYFLYMGNMGDVPYTASFGRRPSVDGFLANLRNDNENPASPISHNINMEFDGASFKLDMDKVTGISGMYLKLCLGRGFSNTTGAYSSNGAGGFNPAYINDDKNPDMDLVGLVAQLYDNGQYKAMFNYFLGFNMMGINPTSPTQDFMDVGDLTGGALSFQVNGIGDGISDFLDDTTFFASFAWSQTDPNNASKNLLLPPTYSFMKGMLGSTEKETGTSYYIGTQMPGVMKGQRLGLEYNHGSKYWRSFTYGEDTLVGSKLAARGDAYEIYYILPLVGKNLTAQLSYIYIDYDYTGSDTFFGMTGIPMDVDATPGAVKTAQNLRASLRYRY